MNLTMRWGKKTDEILVFDLNDTLETRVTRLEIVDARDYERLVYARITGLVWLMMPVHDEPYEEVFPYPPNSEPLGYRIGGKVFSPEDVAKIMPPR